MQTRKPKTGNQIRVPVQLGSDLEKSLSWYVAAAAAAGIGLLALVPQAKAKVVYTPADVPIPVNGGPVPLDLNRDGTPDFSFLNKSWYGDEGEFVFLLGASPNNPSNAVLGRGAFGSSFMAFYGLFAAALPRGFNVGPNKSYFQKSVAWLLVRDKGWFYSSTSAGQWLYTSHRYLGLKFLVGGKIHYGWARLNVTITQGVSGIQATLTGYAYETTPNKSIITGKTKGPDVITVEHATLGRLSKGASAIATWRKN